MDLAEDILTAAWTVFDTLPDTHPLRLDFMSALWCLEDALDAMPGAGTRQLKPISLARLGVPSSPSSSTSEPSRDERRPGHPDRSPYSRHGDAV
ncbi:MAG: hypothetical protein INR66_13270 [Gordonia polyisoprenivorans]|nr:hypothetical protein [Gordonia polyisoprenivorans]